MMYGIPEKNSQETTQWIRQVVNTFASMPREDPIGSEDIYKL